MLVYIVSWQYQRAVAKALLDRVPDEDASRVTTVSVFLCVSRYSVKVDKNHKIIIIVTFITLTRTKRRLHILLKVEKNFPNDQLGKNLTTKGELFVINFR